MKDVLGYLIFKLELLIDKVGGAFVINKAWEW